MRRKILIGIGAALLLIVGGCVTLVGPWPVNSSRFENKKYYTQALAAIDESARESKITPSPGSLKAGWGKQLINPPIGTPLAGYGDRKGKPSTGVHDDIYVTALCLSDGDDTVVLTGSDMLIIPNNVADQVRAAVAGKTPLTPNDILFNASHNHSGPGAWGPGLAGSAFGGKYDPAIVDFLSKAFSEAIVQAYEALEPAGLYAGGVDAQEFIRNRVRQGPVDSELSYMVVQQDDGDKCYLVSFSAHPTVLGGSNMQVSGDFPGFLQRKIEADTNAFAMYLGGATGSMGPRAPDAPDAFAKAQAMGEALAARVVAQPAKPFEKNLDIASIGVPLELPPLQFRISTRWRVSPFLVNFLGVDGYAWLQAVRVGGAVFIGTPCDLSGEISADLKLWGNGKNVDLWPLSFGVDFCGYISPDKYHQNTASEEQYEIRIMSWCGPHQEAYFTSLIKHMVEALNPPAATVS